jgi:YVTN family beta-propeller protein
LGLIPNKVIVDGDYLWSVNSGDNSLQKINRQSGATLTNLLIETGCNPWDACLVDGYLYVTGLFTNKVYKVNTSNNSVEGFITVGISPEALCAYSGKLYVTNTGGYQNNYANSSVSVINLGTFQLETTIPVSPNPQYITVYNGLLHVSCTGNWVSAFGNVCVINPVTNQVIQNLNIGGSIGSIFINSTGQALVGDAGGVNLYRYNAENYTILNDAANPLPSGGSVVDGNADFVALLYPSWGSNGKVRLLHPDLSFWKEYTVALAPTDLKLWQSSTALTEETQSPSLLVTVYPNPAHSGQDISFHLKSAEPSNLSLYDIKGKLVHSQKITTTQTDCKTSIHSTKLSDGIYLYKVSTHSGSTIGKLLLLK